MIPYQHAISDFADAAAADAPSDADAIASGDAFTAALVAADTTSGDVDAIASAVVNVNLLPDLLQFVCPINTLL